MSMSGVTKRKRIVAASPQIPEATADRKIPFEATTLWEGDVG